MATPDTAWNASFETTPANTDDVKEGDDAIRTFKKTVRQILDEDHRVSSITHADDDGYHDKLTLVERTDPTAVTNTGILFMDSADNKLKVLFPGPNVVEIADASGLLTGTLAVDTINEETTDNGVTVDGVLIKDGAVDGVLLKDGAVNMATPGGTANAYTATLNGVPALVTGVEVRFVPGATNTAPATLDVNGLGAASLVRRPGVEMAPGDIQSGAIVVAIYTGTAWQVLNPAGGSDGPGKYGEIAGATPPLGSVLANNQALSRADYAALFAEIGTTYGIGNGSTTFNVPDRRGRYSVGTPTGGTLGAEVGTELSNAENRPVGRHRHSANPGSEDTGAISNSHDHSIESTSGGPSNEETVYRGNDSGNQVTDLPIRNQSSGHTHALNLPEFDTDYEGDENGTNAPYLQVNVTIRA
jgi:microcystin-dependent protein